MVTLALLTNNWKVAEWSIHKMQISPTDTPSQPQQQHSDPNSAQQTLQPNPEQFFLFYAYFEFLRGNKKECTDWLLRGLAVWPNSMRLAVFLHRFSLFGFSQEPQNFMELLSNSTNTLAHLQPLFILEASQRGSTKTKIDLTSNFSSSMSHSESQAKALASHHALSHSSLNWEWWKIICNAEIYRLRQLSLAYHFLGKLGPIGIDGNEGAKLMVSFASRAIRVNPTEPSSWMLNALSNYERALSTQTVSSWKSALSASKLAQHMIASTKENEKEKFLLQTLEADCLIELNDFQNAKIQLEKLNKLVSTKPSFLSSTKYSSFISIVNSKFFYQSTREKSIELVKKSLSPLATTTGFSVLQFISDLVRIQLGGGVSSTKVNEKILAKNAGTPSINTLPYLVEKMLGLVNKKGAQSQQELQTILKHCLAQFPKSSVLHLIEGMSFSTQSIEQGNSSDLLNNAINSISVAVSLDPRLKMANYLLGMLHIRAKENSLAESDFLYEQDNFPKSALANFQLAQLAAQSGNKEAHRSLIQRAIHLNPSISAFWKELK